MVTGAAGFIGSHVVEALLGLSVSGSSTVDRPIAAVKALARLPALWNRRSGSRSNARSKKRSIAGLNPGTSEDGAGTLSLQILTITSPISSPWNGGSPVTARYAMTASDQRSLR